LALIVDPALAVGLMLPLLMLIDAATLKPYWKRWSWPDARLLILGAAPGVAIGALFWSAADADVLRVFLGVISLAFVAFQLARAQNWIRIPDRSFPPARGFLQAPLVASQALSAMQAARLLLSIFWRAA
jgi:uncharacterized membrane protein YfcA